VEEDQHRQGRRRAHAARRVHICTHTFPHVAHVRKPPRPSDTHTHRERERETHTYTHRERNTHIRTHTHTHTHIHIHTHTHTHTRRHTHTVFLCGPWVGARTEVEAVLRDAHGACVRRQTDAVDTLLRAARLEVARHKRVGPGPHAHTDRQTDRDTNRQRETDRETERQTDRERDRRIDRQRDTRRERDRQTDGHTHRYAHIRGHICTGHVRGGNQGSGKVRMCVRVGGCGGERTPTT
jgi:hypothetical protein